CNLPLDHDHHALDRQVGQQEVGNDRHGDGVGQVGDQLDARAVEAAAQLIDLGEDLRPNLILVLQNVGVQQGEVVAAVQEFAHHLVKGRVDLDAEDGAGQVAQARGQAAGAAADLDRQVVLRQLGGGHHHVEDVEVDEEVLAELALGPD